MGRDKATLPFGPDETMLARVVRLMACAVPAGRTVCIAAAGQELPTLPGDVRVVRDASPFLGPLAGLAVGLATMGEDVDAVFACGCDAPMLAPAFVGRMFESLGGHQIAVPHDGERWQPLAAVYRGDVLGTAQQLLAARERSLVALLERCDAWRVAVEELRDVDPDLGSLRRCNTADEYEALVRDATHSGLGHGAGREPRVGRRADQPGAE